MGSGLDLRKYQDTESIQDAFSKIVSGGKTGYKTVIERKKVPPKCNQCGRGGDEDQKFCPGCKKSIDDAEKFCTNCGHNLIQARASALS